MEEMEKLDITNLKQQHSDLGVSKNDNNWDISGIYHTDIPQFMGNFHSEKMINPWFLGVPWYPLLGRGSGWVGSTPSLMTLTSL